jgi:hypothetical protein
MHLPIKNQHGYIGLTVISFLIALTLILYPWAPPKSEEGKCRVGDPPGGYFELKGLPAIKNMEDSPRLGEASDLDLGGPDPTEKSDFVLIRKNVPTSYISVPPGWVIFGGTTKSGTAHTVNVGVLPQKPGFDAYYPAEWGEMDIPGKGRKYIRGEGMLLFANNNPATMRRGNGNTIYLVDVYQDKRIFTDKTKGYQEGDLFICGVDTVVGTSNVISPYQAVSPTKDQLQLEWFLLASDKVWGIHCKPAVYLYPERKQLVNVKVYPKGELILTDPPYDAVRGWNVEAFPDGSLYEIRETKYEKRYPYLYYESKIRDEEIKKPTEGWVVKYDQLENLYSRVLPKLGLNKKEQADFTDYWLKNLPESPYYFVGLIEKSQRDYLEALDVTPQPDTSIRFSLYFEALDQPKAVIEPKIETPVRNGFTLVDWGGMVKLHPETPFTCSQ